MIEIQRIKIALEFLKDGQSFRVGDLQLGMINEQRMFVTGWSQYSNIKNLTRPIALQELEEIKSLFEKMLGSSKDLKDYVQNKHIKYNLDLDYGKGGIGICSEDNGIIKWEVDLK